MTIYGTNFWEAGTKVNEASGSFSVGATTAWQNAYNWSDFDEGTYIAWMCLSPSTTDSHSPNSDPDAYEIRIVRNGSAITVEAHQPESTPDTCRRTTMVMCTFQSNGTDDITLQYRTTDADAGGVYGRIQGGAHCIMRRA